MNRDKKKARNLLHWRGDAALFSYPCSLLKHIFGFLEEVAEDVFIILLVLFAFEACELLKQVFLLGRQVSRRHDLHDDMLVAACAAMHHRYPQPFQAEGAIALRAGRNFEHNLLAVDCGDGNLIAQRGLCEADRHLIDDVVALALEEGVRLHREDHIEITGRAAPRTDFALAGHADIDAIIDTCGNIHHDMADIAHAALASALLTGGRNHIPFAATALAHRHVDELAEDGLLHAPDLAGSLAGCTTRLRCPRLRAAAPAGRAG